MCNHSEEGNTKCLGIFNTRVRKFPDKDIVPHMGWNNLTIQKSKLLQNLSNNDDFYFVHSYFAEIGENTVAQCDYINPFSAVLQKNNFYAVQFHPEKSAKAGRILLQNFLNL
jgi:glutamine amidotransferase